MTDIRIEDWPGSSGWYVVYLRNDITGCIDMRVCAQLPNSRNYAVFYKLTAIEQDNIRLAVKDFITLKSIIGRLLK